MQTRYYYEDYVSGFVPEIALKEPGYKYPLHWRGRILIGCSLAAWAPIVWGVVHLVHLAR